MATQPISPRRGRRSKELLRRLDHSVGQINPYLLAIALGFGILYVTCLLTLIVKLPVVHMNVCVTTPTAAAGDSRQQ